MAKEPPGVVAAFSTPDGSGLTQMAISSDKTVLLGSDRGTVWKWSPRKSLVRELFAPTPDHSRVSNLRFDQEGNLFLRRGPELMIQTIAGERKTVKLPQLPHLDVSPNGRQLAAVGEEPPILFLDPITGKKTHRVDRQVLVDEIRYAPDSRRVVTYRFGRLYLWDSDSGDLANKIRLEVNIRGVVFSPNGKSLFAAVDQEGVWVIDISSGDILERLKRPHPVNLDAVRHSLTAGKEGSPISESRPIDEKKLRHRFAISADGTLLAESRPDRYLEIWETFTGRPVLLLEQHPGEITDLHFLPDGLHLASGDDEGKAYLWDLTASEFAGTFDVSQPYSQEELAKLWRMLGEFHGHASWSAMSALKHRPEQALLLLEDPPNDDLLIQQLIERLDDDQFSVRQAAYRTLKQLSLKAEPFLQQTIDTATSAELKIRIRRLLAYLQGPQREAQRQWMEESRTHRRLRTVQLLKWIGTPEAKAQLIRIRESFEVPAVREQAQKGSRMAERKSKAENQSWGVSSLTVSALFASARTIKLTTIFEVSLYAMVALSSAMLTLSEGLRNGPPPQAFTIPLVIAAYIIVDRRRMWVLPGWAAGGLGILAVAAAFWETIQSIRFQGGIPHLEEERVLNLIFAGAHLLVFLTWIVLFMEKTSRQYWWLWALCVLEIAVGASQTTASLYGVCLSVYLFLAVWTLSVFSLLQGQQQFDRAQQTAESTHSPEKGAASPRLPSAPPASFLKKETPKPPVHPLLGVWRQPSSAVGNVQRDPAVSWINSRFIGGVLGTGGLAFVLALLFFLLIPRHPAIWGTAQAKDRSSSNPASVVGFSRELSLGEMGQILESTKKVMEVRLTDFRTKEPVDIEKYAQEMGYGEPLFRGMTAIRYEDGRWLALEPGESYYGGTMFLPRIGIPRGEMVRQDIHLEAIDPELLFAMPPAKFGNIENSADSIQVESLNDILKRPTPSSPPEAVQYTILSPRFPAQRGTLPVRPPVVHFLQERSWMYLVMPRNLSKLRRLALEKSGKLESPAPTKFEMAQRLKDYLKNPGEFRYTLNAKVADPEIDPLEDFLFNRKMGHCEYFASALTLMLRAPGIPSRLVSGFKGGTKNEKTGLFEVEERHAHAWVEAYIDGNWVILDPTPASRSESVEQIGSQSGGWKVFTQNLRNFWSRFIVGLNEAEQRRLFAPLKNLVAGGLALARNWRVHFKSFAQALNQQLSSPERWISWQGGLVTFVLLTFLSGLVWGSKMFWRMAQRWRAHYLDPRGLSRTVEFYERFRRICAVKGLARQTAQTPKEFAVEVRNSLGPWLKTADWDHFPVSLVDAYYNVRYGAGEFGAETLQSLDEQLTRFETLLTQPAEAAPNAAR